MSCLHDFGHQKDLPTDSNYTYSIILSFHKYLVKCLWVPVVYMENTQPQKTVRQSHMEDIKTGSLGSTEEGM